MMYSWGKKKRASNSGKSKRKKLGAGPNSAYLDHLVESYDQHGFYDEPILLTSPAHRGIGKLKRLKRGITNK